jgi:glutamate synthase (NADPH/NADH) small chain
MMAEKVTKKVKKEKIPRVSMPEQEPEIRARNFLEVPTGYTEEMAMTEAQRCLQCKKPGCVAGCPVEIDIPGFIQLIKDGDFTKSIRHIWQKNSLPAVCGRVCPQEIQCEGLCILAKKPKKGIRSPSVTWKGSQPTGKEKMVPGRYPQQPSPPGKELLSLVPVLPV